MGMIDKTIEELKAFHHGFTGYAGDFQQTLDNAIEMAEKYQKIEQIVKVWHQDIYAKDFECMAEIAEVVENGNDDN